MIHEKIRQMLRSEDREMVQLGVNYLLQKVTTTEWIDALREMNTKFYWKVDKYGIYFEDRGSRARPEYEDDTPYEALIKLNNDTRKITEHVSQ